ncbi:rRNA maturation RNase YbeY [Chloroflexota bacterium]
MIHVEFNPSLDSSFDAHIIQKAGQITLDHCQPDQDSDLTILLTNDEQVRELNRKYLSNDEVTDVLSFSSLEVDPDSKRMYLGDVIISQNRAMDQAQQAGHDVEVELHLLVVHGVLHLLGFDHAEQEQKAKMWAAQEFIMKKLGHPDFRIMTENG